MQKRNKVIRTLGMTLLGCILLTTSVEAGTLKGLNQNDTTLVPMRVISEELGAKVDFDGPSKTITVSHKESVIVAKIGSKTATVNGVKEEVRVAPQIVDSITYVPFRFIGEALGGVVDYQKGSLRITLGDEEKQWDLETTVHQVEKVESSYYAELINTYRTAINEQWENDQIRELELGTYLNTNIISDGYSYTFADINKDGMPEMITGFTHEDDITSVDAIYMLIDGVPTRIFTGGPRYYAAWYQDGTLRTWGGSWGSFSVGFHDLKADGTMELKAGYKEDKRLHQEKLTNLMEPYELISEEEAKAMGEQYGEEVNISFTPFVVK